MRWDFLEPPTPEDVIGPLQAALRRADVPLRSWLLFFDDVWRDEWVGVWPETPPPPRRADP